MASTMREPATQPGALLHESPAPAPRLISRPASRAGAPAELHCPRCLEPVGRRDETCPSCDQWLQGGGATAEKIALRTAPSRPGELDSGELLLRLLSILLLPGPALVECDVAPNLLPQGGETTFYDMQTGECAGMPPPAGSEPAPAGAAGAPERLLPFPPGGFRSVVLWGSLNRLTQGAGRRSAGAVRRAYLAAARRALAPDGVLVVSADNLLSPTNVQDNARRVLPAPHSEAPVRPLTFQGYANLLAEQGCAVRDAFCVIPNLSAPRALVSTSHCAAATFFEKEYDRADRTLLSHLARRLMTRTNAAPYLQHSFLFLCRAS